MPAVTTLPGEDRGASGTHKAKLSAAVCVPFQVLPLTSGSFGYAVLYFFHHNGLENASMDKNMMFDSSVKFLCHDFIPAIYLPVYNFFTLHK